LQKLTLTSLEEKRATILNPRCSPRRTTPTMSGESSDNAPAVAPDVVKKHTDIKDDAPANVLATDAADEKPAAAVAASAADAPEASASAPSDKEAPSKPDTGKPLHCRNAPLDLLACSRSDTNSLAQLPPIK